MSQRPYIVIVCGGCGEDMQIMAASGCTDEPFELTVEPCQECANQAVIEWKLRIK